MRMIKKLFVKKVRLSEVADPKPSRAARVVLNNALKQAYNDQKTLRQKAEAIRSHQGMYKLKTAQLYF